MNKISFLPYRNMTCKSSLSIEDCMTFLRKNVQREKLINLPIPTLLTPFFEGHIFQRSFTIKRIVPFFYINSFLPIIDGKLKKIDHNTTEVNILFRLRQSSYFIIGISNAIPLFMIIYLVIVASWDKVVLIMVLILLGMIIFSYLLTTIVFNYEVKAAKKYLLSLLKVVDNN